MAGVIDTSEFRKGLKIEVDGEPFEIVEFQHVKPGKGSAFVRTSIKSLLSGRLLQPTFKSGDKVGKPDIEERTMRARTKTMISLLAPVLILVVGAMVGFMVIAILLPIFSMSQALQK